MTYRSGSNEAVSTLILRRRAWHVCIRFSATSDSLARAAKLVSGDSEMGSEKKKRRRDSEKGGESRKKVKNEAVAEEQHLEENGTVMNGHDDTSALTVYVSPIANRKCMGYLCLARRY